MRLRQKLVTKQGDGWLNREISGYSKQIYGCLIHEWLRSERGEKQRSLRRVNGGQVMRWVNWLRSEKAQFRYEWLSIERWQANQSWVGNSRNVREVERRLAKQKEGWQIREKFGEVERGLAKQREGWQSRKGVGQSEKRLANQRKGWQIREKVGKLERRLAKQKEGWQRREKSLQCRKKV